MSDSPIISWHRIPRNEDEGVEVLSTLAPVAGDYELVDWRIDESYSSSTHVGIVCRWQKPQVQFKIMQQPTGQFQ